MEIEHLVGVAHPYIPVNNQVQLVRDHLVRSLDNRTLQRHLLTVDTATMAGTIRAIEEDLAIGNCDCPVCKAMGEETESSPLI